ncbi:hypothetical protein C7974DRAFT_447969 [Boeremia exigua]|uniref:uncharacterized protein n=1 Tax=Boeremia exigua TaxID=749465 RepID=UPI001E8E20BC|nr:uncharacterized protein C7974DRAFT_447969 [Boeremia exigua]KAH6643034.1 hypothetical protein C7974DRAFT_447969 [Boeremia exigua]
MKSSPGTNSRRTTRAQTRSQTRSPPISGTTQRESPEPGSPSPASSQSRPADPPSTPPASIQRGPAEPPSPSPASTQRNAPNPALPTTPPPPSPNTCTHPRHPAHAHPPTPLCPLCTLTQSLTHFHAPSTTLLAHGGSTPWQTSLAGIADATAAETSRQLCAFVSGRKRARGSNGIQHVDGAGGLSYPRARTGVLRVVRGLEVLRGEEEAWEREREGARDSLGQGQGQGGEDVTGQAEAARPWSAGAALEKWGRERAAFGRNERVAGRRARGRGLMMQGAVLEGWPGPEDYWADRRAVIEVTAAQRAFLAGVGMDDDGAGGEAESESEGEGEDGEGEDGEGADGEGVPRRKRRCGGARVVFDPHAYVRADADVDSLFRPSVRVSAPVPLPLRSILRTAPRRIHQLPARAHVVVDMVVHERHVSPRRRRVVVDTIVDTSGSRRRPEEWDAYRTALAAEVEGDDLSKEAESDLSEEVEGDDLSKEVEGDDLSVEAQGDDLSKEVEAGCIVS